MNQLESHRLTFLKLVALGLAHVALGCSGDDNHGPPIGAPSGPVVIIEGGGSGPTGSGGSSGSGTGAGETGVGAPFNAGGSLTGIAGLDFFPGAAGTDPFGAAGALTFGQAGLPQVGGAGTPASF
jgi:hypothetical protein